MGRGEYYFPGPNNKRLKLKTNIVVTSRKLALENTWNCSNKIVIVTFYYNDIF